jgi:hypothetical protein
VVDYEKIYNHFITSGYKEGRKSSALFDGAYYCEKYPDVASSYKDEYLRHYVETGIYEGRRASLTFHADYYWFIRPDVAQAWPGDYHMAARHYAGHGIIEQVEAYDHSHPVISNAVISDVSASGYTVTCTVTDNWGLSKVSFPSWTLLNGQDDLADQFMKTQVGTKNGDTYTFQVKISDHNNEKGFYTTHIYAKDCAGNTVSLALDSVEVKDPTTVEPTDPPVVEPTLKEITPTNSSKYAIDKKMVSNIAANTSVAALLTQFQNETLEVVDNKGKVLSGSALVGTGAKINLYENNKLIDSVTVVILGDVDGNGIVDTTDVVRVKAAFLGTFTLSDAETLAADVDKSGVIDTTDYMRVKSHFLGTYDLYA